MDRVDITFTSPAGEQQPVAPGDGGRTRKRDSLFLSAKLRFGGETAVHEGRVRNLSAGGLMIELDRVAEPGTPVTLDLRGVGEVGGTVAWHTAGRLGVAFDQPIDPARARKPVGAAKRADAPLIVPTRRG